MSELLALTIGHRYRFSVQFTQLIEQFFCCLNNVLFPNRFRMFNYNDGIMTSRIFLYGVNRFHSAFYPPAEFSNLKATVPAFSDSAAVIAVVFLVSCCNLPDLIFGEKQLAMKTIIQHGPLVFRDLAAKLELKAIGRVVLNDRYSQVSSLLYWILYIVTASHKAPREKRLGDPYGSDLYKKSTQRMNLPIL